MEQDLKCLICDVSISHAHLGIDSCRACATFYKRALNLKRALKCKGGDNDCLKKDPTCRKCRFYKFKEVFDRACAGEIPEWGQKVLDSDESLEGVVDEPSPSFIDHNSHFDAPSCSDTPLLDRIKRAYSTLCLVRKSGEMATIQRSSMHSLLRDDNLILLPAKYSTVVANARILFSAAMDFARSSFEDYKNLSPEIRYQIIFRNGKLIQMLDGAYRGHHYFPNDDTIMASYLTFVNEETSEEFFKDCSYAINTKEAAHLFIKNMERTVVINKAHFRKMKPSSEEFVALLGLAIWSDSTSNISAELAHLVNCNRAAIMDDLHKMYAGKGIADYASRLGELLCLLVNVQSALDVTNEDIEVYRMMNLFNEAFEDT